MQQIQTETYDLKKDSGRSLADQAHSAMAAEVEKFRSGPYHHLTRIRLRTTLTESPDGSGKMTVSFFKLPRWTLTSVVFYAVMLVVAPLLNWFYEPFSMGSFGIGVAFGTWLTYWKIQRIKKGLE